MERKSERRNKTRSHSGNMNVYYNQNVITVVEL